MAAPAGRMVQDQNLNISAATMLDGLKIAKKGSIGGRKALNDISNSSKLSALAAREQRIGDKESKPKVPVKGQSSGRKALGDLTNTKFARSSSKQNGFKKVHPPIPSAIKDEQFLHNHEECLKVQRKGMQYKQFLETIGLGSPPPLQAPNSQVESPVKNMEMKEIPEFSDIDQSCCLSVYSSPARDIRNESCWGIGDESFVEFKLIESPMLNKF